MTKKLNEQQHRALNRLQAAKRLTLGARIELLARHVYDPLWTESDSGLAVVLTEIACADRVRDKWTSEARTGIENIPLVSYDVMKKVVGTGLELSDPVTSIPSMLGAFSEMVAEELGENARLFFRSEGKEAVAACGALLAVQRATLAIVLGGRDLAPVDVDMFDCDPEDRWAADFAEPEGGVEERKAYWSWYINEAVPAAFAEVDRRRKA
jgi:hypothetical protein